VVIAASDPSAWTGRARFAPSRLAWRQSQGGTGTASAHSPARRALASCSANSYCPAPRASARPHRPGTTKPCPACPWRGQRRESAGRWGPRPVRPRRDGDLPPLNCPEAQPSKGNLMPRAITRSHAPSIQQDLNHWSVLLTKAPTCPSLNRLPESIYRPSEIMGNPEPQYCRTAKGSGPRPVCVAFELGTSAGFHVLSAAESVLRRYWDHVSNGKPRQSSGISVSTSGSCVQEPKGDPAPTQSHRT
jgi:hypothetical protein